MRLILTNLYQVLFSFIYVYFENKNAYELKILARKSNRNFTNFKKVILQNFADWYDRVNSFCSFTLSLITEKYLQGKFSRWNLHFPNPAYSNTSSYYFDLDDEFDTSHFSSPAHDYRSDNNYFRDK